jgi:hypothetical protein
MVFNFFCNKKTFLLRKFAIFIYKKCNYNNFKQNSSKLFFPAKYLNEFLTKKNNFQISAISWNFLSKVLLFFGGGIIFLLFFLGIFQNNRKFCFFL